jgi:integrase
MLVTLWRWAADNDLCDLPQKLRSVRVPENVPTAFTIDDMQRLLWAANYLNNPLYWKSLLLAAYDTALRLGDLLSIERQDIWPDGSLSIVQRKTGRTHRVQLRPETMEAIESYLNGRKTGTIWPLLTQTRNGFYAVFRRLKRWAKMENGSMKWLRRASASYVEASHPGMGWRHLGHAAPGLAEKCYLDPKIVRPKPTLPPRLTG